MPLRTLILASLTFALLAARAPAQAPTTAPAAVAPPRVDRWVEAERPVVMNFPAVNPFAPATADERAKLSGDAWIGAWGPRRGTLYAAYDVDVPAAGDYQFYARKFWKHGPYRVSFNNGPWLDVGAEIALLDTVELRPQVCANWTSAGTVALKAGRNRFRVEATTNDGAIAFDCFLITDGRFNARGLLRPDARLTADEPGWFAWDPAPDAAGSPIDLRWMNEPVAGADGRILARDGRFVHERTGKPVRFWGVNFGPDIARLGDGELEHLAALLAARGVNHVRWHGPIYAQDGPDAGKLDGKQVANLGRAVRTFKRHGIYSTLSIYYPMWLTLDQAGGWPGYKKQTPFALLFFDAKFQAMYRGWWRALLDAPGPNGEPPLRDEPAVLSLEIVNEDSCFFWTFQPYKLVPAPLAEVVERRFAMWLAKRYGSLDAAMKRWPSESVEGDRPGEGRAGIANLWRIANVRDARSKDTARFLHDVQRDFYADTRAFLRDELGSASLVSASNWMTASDEYLTPIERSSNMAGDFIDRHAYYGAVHEGPRAGYSISDGDKYADRSALRFDAERPDDSKLNRWNPLLDTSYGDHPTMVSEVDWLEPNRFRTEAPLLSAALGAQQDVDALTFFSASGPTWQPTLAKFSVLTPVALGQYPAAAMIYRLGLVDEAPPVVDARLNLDELLDLGGGIKGVDSAARLAGRMRVAIDAGPTSRPAVDAARFHDAGAKTIRSATGQVTLDYGRGVLAIDAPRAAALVGFLGALGDGGRTIGEITVRSPMEYGAIAIVALDGEPLASSKRVLVQAMSEQRNAGWRTRGSPLKTIESFGTAPIVVRELAGSVAFADGSAWTARPLDQNGQPIGPALPASSALTLAPATPYYVLTRVP